MGSHIKKVSRFFSIFYILSFAVLICSFLGCSNEVPDIVNTELCVIYDYENDEVYPDARLCAFIESGINVRRYDTLQLKNMKDGYTWNADNLVLYQSSRKLYAGYTNFVMPKNKRFSNTTYNVELITADEKSVSSQINFHYDDSFYKIKASDVENKFKDLKGIKKIAIFNKDDVLIFSDKYAARYDSAEKIKNTFRNAEYYSIYWQTSDKTVICVMPKQYISKQDN